MRHRLVTRSQSVRAHRDPMACAQSQAAVRDGAPLRECAGMSLDRIGGEGCAAADNARRVEPIAGSRSGAEQC